MRDLLEIQRDVQDTNAGLSRMEGALTKAPNLPSLHATIKGLRQRQKILEEEFLKAANERGEDVCNYRLFAGDGRPTIDMLSKALGSFQAFFTSVYDAIKHGPKDRPRYSASVVDMTSFRFGYTYPGSVGIVFTLPNDRLLPSLRTEIDISMSMIRAISKSDTPEDIKTFAKQLGDAPIRAAYKWAESHANNYLSADVQWRRDQEIKDEFLVQPIELERLKNNINMSGDETVETLIIPGLLVGVNTLRHTFHIVSKDDEDIRGKFTDAISFDHTVELPKRYVAVLRKTTIVQFSSEKPEEDYFLLELKSSL